MKKKRSIALLLSFVMVMAAAMSGNLQVRAEDPQPRERTYEIIFTDGNVSGNMVSYAVGESTVVLTSGVAISDDKVIVEENDEFTLSDSFNPDTMEVIVYADDGFRTTLNVADRKTSIANKTNEGGVPDSVKLKIQEKANDFPEPPEGPECEFDGIAYFVWQGAGDTLCVHKITGLEASRSDGEKISFDIIYIPVSEVKDDNTGEPFVIGNKNYFWAWSSAEQFIEDNSSSYSAFVEAIDNFSYDEKRSTLIDPCGAVDGESTVCTNGDRTFRATIYADSTFEGVAFSQNENDYAYFPSFWDNVFFTNTVDISGTSEEDPAIYEAFLLEPTIHFGEVARSVDAFTGVRALNVPDGAVTITGNATNGYDIEFASNFFDNVVFEITTANGNYYLQIVRTAIQVFDIAGPEVENTKIVAKVFYDEGESYSDYEVYATIHYADGSVSIQKTSVSEITDDGLGNTLPAGTYEMEAGKGLKCAEYSIPAAEDIVGIDFNAVKSGALLGNTYGGSYFGSENGVYYDVEARRVIY